MKLNEISEGLTQIPLTDVKLGDYVTTIGIGACSGGDGYDIVERVTAINTDGDLLVDGWDGAFSAETFKHSSMMYRLGRAFTPKVQPK